MKNNMNQWLLVAAVASLLMACEATHLHHKGVMPHADIAIIKGVPGWNPLSVAAVQVYRIDEKKLEDAKQVYEVLPGLHTIKVRCSRNQPEFVQKYYTFKFELKAGHQYAPKVDMRGDCDLDYIDVNTGQRFKGIED